MHLGQVAEHTLSNGLKVLILRKSSAPVASVQVWYRTGSAHERDGIRGISHLLEHMMFRGSATVGPEEHARRINEVGGHANAFTSEDVTGYTNSVPAEHLDLVLSLEAERMHQLALDSAILETERKVILEEYHTYMNNPVAKAFLEFRRGFFDGHPYAIGPLGLLEDIQRITADDCRAYYGAWYRPPNATLVIVGDVDTQSALEKVSASFSAVPAGPAVVAPAIAAAPSFMQAVEMTRRIEFDVPMQIHGFSTPPVSHPDALALEVTMSLLAHGESSRLHRTLVREQGVAVMAGGSNLFLRQAGMSLVFAAFTPDISRARVRRSLEEQVRRVCAGDIRSDELEKVRNSMLTQRTFELYTAEHLCQRLGAAQSLEGGYRKWVDRLDDLRRIDVERVTQTARAHWDYGRAWMLTLVPKRTRFALVAAGLLRRLFAPKALVSGGAS